jgi:ribonuclease P protein subunit POP4
MLNAELIGAKMHIVDATNKSLICNQGIIVDETRNTFKLDVNGKSKIILKNQITADVTTKKGTVRISGSKLIGRPEERIKKW